MSKDLVNVIRKLESLGLIKEAGVIKTAINKHTGRYDLETSTVGTIWLAETDVYDSVIVNHYFARKIDAEEWLKSQQEDPGFGDPQITEVDVEVITNLPRN
jgi:hypothetical protein